MRGASAVQKAIEKLPGSQLRVFVIWEPVIASDVAPPTTRVLSRLHDPRAVQFWDPGRLVSAELVSAARSTSGPVPECIGAEKDAIVWDFVAILSRGTRWEDSLLEGIEFSGCTVVGAIDEVEKRLRNERAETAPPPPSGTASGGRALRPHGYIAGVG